MKSFKILITAFAMVAVLFTGCKKEVVTGIDTSKAGVTDFTYDEENSSSTSIAFYWDAAEAVKAGATSFSVQLAQNADFTDIDMYDSAIGQTIQVSANPNDAVIMTGLVENTWYYARVRANYARSVYSDWTVLTKDNSVVCIAVGHGIVVMEFLPPQGLSAKALKYDKISAAWGIVAPADGYAPEYKKASDSQWIVLPETENAGFTVDGLDEDTEYTVRVRAFRNADGGSAKDYTEYTPEVTVKTPIKVLHDLKNAADVKAFFSEGLAKATNSDIYYLKADVDVEGEEFPCAGTFPCEFFGENHAIKGAKFNEGIAAAIEGSIDGVTFDGCTFKDSAFGKVAAEASITNVAFTATSKFDFGTPTGGGYGILAGVNEGTIKNCSTASNSEVSAESVPSAECYIGGLIGLNKGVVENCHNTGTFSLSIAAPTSGSYHWFGGVVGQVSGLAGKTILKDCSNSGAVTLEYQTKVYFCVGGVTGGTPSVGGATGNYGIIDNCDNSGAVTMHYIAGGSGAYPNIGGVAGYAEAYLQNCDNTGKISLICDSKSETWTNARLAGVAGAVTRGAKDCTNKGELFIQALTAGGTAGARQSGNVSSTCIAGVIAAAGPYEGHSADIVFEGLKNEANLSITPSSTTGTPNSYYGGCLGYVSGSVKNCSNTGNITSSSPIAINRIGGIAGGASYNIEGCTNSGSINLVQDLSAASGDVGSFRVYLAGICGHYDGNGSSYVKACTNSGNVDYKCTPAAKYGTSKKESGLAGILGYSENNIAPADDCTNTGAFTFAGNSKTKTNAIVNIGLN